MHTRTAPATFAAEDGEPINHSIGAGIKINYARDLAMTEPDQPGGRIVFSTADCETDEEADAALEEFFTRIIEAPYEE
jgi:phage anti-repressor protein